jgi:hypothetical protein
MFDPIGISAIGPIARTVRDAAALLDVLGRRPGVAFARACDDAVPRLRIKLMTASPLAQVPEGKATRVAAAENHFFRGRALMLGFDPEAAPSARMEAALGAWLSHAAEAPKLERLARTPAAVRWSLRNESPGARDVRVEVRLPSGSTVLEAAPALSISDPPTWTFAIAAQENRELELEFRPGEDPEEKRDLAAAEPARVRSMAERIERWRALYPPDGIYDPKKTGPAPKQWAEAAK